MSNSTRFGRISFTWRPATVILFVGKDSAGETPASDLAGAQRRYVEGILVFDTSVRLAYPVVRAVAPAAEGR